MFNDVVTVFNYYESANGAFWYPHVLSGVSVNTDRGQIIKKYGADSKDNAFLIVPYIPNMDKKEIFSLADKALSWHPPKTWKKQVNDDLEESITFDNGDFFWIGKWEGEVPINDYDYADRRNEGFYAYMNSNEDFVFRITSVGGPYSVIPHFEILGA